MAKKDDEKLGGNTTETIDSLIDYIKSTGMSIDPHVEDTLYILKDVMAQLQQENESLWFMLDEIRSSDIEEHAEALDKALEQIKLEAIMKNMKPVEA